MSDRDASGDLVTLMFVPGSSGQIRRFNFPRAWIRRGAVACVALCALLLGLGVDYVRARLQLSELDYLRGETREQRDQLLGYSERMTQISEELKRVSSFDRKLRVITNLDPADPAPLTGIGGVEGELLAPAELNSLTRDRRHARMMTGLGHLHEAAGAQAESLLGLVAHLEDQSTRLRHTPSVAPTKGWATSAFGHRTSPFTGHREFHRGLDIAGRLGTPVLAPADGEVRYAGHQRALGNSVRIRHGYGMETIYGHLKEISVKAGQKIARGQALGTMGTTGRSTGPHLHYQVEVNGKPVNPRNYVLD